MIVHAADVQDADGVGDLLKRLKRLYPWLRAVFADGVYDRLAALLACFLLGLTLVIVRRLAGTTGFVLLPRRWVAERTLGWLGRWRRLAREYEELPEVSETMVKLAMIRLMLHRLAHPNRKRLPAPDFANGLLAASFEVKPASGRQRWCRTYPDDGVCRDRGRRVPTNAALPARQAHCPSRCRRHAFP